MQENNGRAAIGESRGMPGRRGRVRSRASMLGLVTAGVFAVGAAISVPVAAATAAPAASSATSPNFSIFNPPTQANPSSGESPQALTGVYAASPTDVWAVGTASGGPFWNWNGTSWTAQGLPAGIATAGNSQVSVDFITGTSADNITAVGNGIIDTGTSGIEESVAFHFNGTSWSNMTIPAKVELGPITAFSATNVWSVNDKGDAEHFNGSRWTKTKLPIPSKMPSLDMTSISGSSPSDIWAAGFVQTSPGLHGHNESPVLEHFNGTKWTNVTVPVASPAGGLSDVVAITPSDAYLVSGEGILHWNGSTWTMLNATTTTGVGVTGVIAALSPTDVWVGNGATLDNFNGTTWTSVLVPSTAGLTPAGQTLAGPDAAAAVGPGSVWFVGETFTAAGDFGFPYAIGTSNG